MTSLLRLFCSTLVLGLCSFDLLPEALHEIDSFIGMCFVYIGVCIHQILHIFVPHTHTTTTAQSCTTRPNPFQTAFDLGACQECDPNPSSTNNVTSQASNTKSRLRPGCVTLIVLTFHSFLDGIMLGTLLPHIEGVATVGVALGLCLVQDMFVLAHKLSESMFRFDPRQREKTLVTAVGSVCGAGGVGLWAGAIVKLDTSIVYSILCVCIGTLLCEALEGISHLHTSNEATVALFGTIVSAGLSQVHQLFQ